MNPLTSFKLNHGNRTMNLAFIFLLLSIPLTSKAQPQVAEMASVQNCHYLNKVEGSSGYGKNNNWQSLAKYSALSRADQLGASHVVWDQLYSVGGFNGVVIAKAYNCDSYTANKGVVIVEPLALE
ncbi:MAG: hypothetical protein NTV66_12295 [Methylococcales bacterium]|jgi:hypothetical protein|nr:hypothetical protein [Methylococcales bacterium]